MNGREAKDFLEINADALKLLSDKMRQIDTVRDCNDEVELRGRQRAIEIVSSWMFEIFGISQESLEIPRDEDNLYIQLVKGRNE